MSIDGVDCDHSTRILHGVRSGMASVRLQPPSPLDFRTPDEWPCWKRRFEQFRQAPGLAAEDDSRQISTLLYCMGDNAEDTLASTDISCADRSRYATVIAKFDAFFQVRKTSFSNARGSTGTTKKKASPQSNSSPVSTVWPTTVPTAT